MGPEDLISEGLDEELAKAYRQLQGHPYLAAQESKHEKSFLDLLEQTYFTLVRPDIRDATQAIRKLFAHLGIPPVGYRRMRRPHYALLASARLLGLVLGLRRILHFSVDRGYFLGSAVGTPRNRPSRRRTSSAPGGGPQLSEDQIDSILNELGAPSV